MDFANRCFPQNPLVACCVSIVTVMAKGVGGDATSYHDDWGVVAGG